MRRSLAGTITSVASSETEDALLLNLQQDQYRADSMASVISESDATNRLIKVCAENTK